MPNGMQRYLPMSAGGSQSGPTAPQRSALGVGTSSSRGANAPTRGGSTGVSRSGLNRPVGGGSNVGGYNSPGLTPSRLAAYGIGPNFESYNPPAGATMMEGNIGAGLYMAGQGATPRAQALAIAEAMVGTNRGVGVDSKEEFRDSTTTRSASTAVDGREVSSRGSTINRTGMSSGINSSRGGSLTLAQQGAIQRATGYTLPRVDRHGSPIRYEFEFGMTDRFEQVDAAAHARLGGRGISVSGGAAGSIDSSRGGSYMVRQGIDLNTGLPYNVREPLTTTSSHQVEGSVSLGGRHFRLPQIPGVTHRYTETVHHPSPLPDTRRPAPTSMPSRAQMIREGTVVPAPSESPQRGGGYWLP